MNILSQRTAASWAPKLVSLVRMAAGLLLLQHGAEKLWGFAGGRIDHNFASLHGIAGPLETLGGILLVLGLFTRSTAFILSGEMAVAYLGRWPPRTFWPINNAGKEAAIYAFLLLWLVTAGPGPWSLDPLLARQRRDFGLEIGATASRVSGWEDYSRFLLRVTLAFMVSLHGFRLLFGFFAAARGRRGAAPMALDQLSSIFGLVIIVAAAMLFLGLYSRLAALTLSSVALISYVYAAMPAGPWPIRNGGSEVVAYFFAFMYLTAVGGGIWSLDSLAQRKSSKNVTVAAGART